MEDPAWERELERRIRIYEQMEASGHWPGRLTVDRLLGNGRADGGVHRRPLDLGALR